MKGSRIGTVFFTLSHSTVDSLVKNLYVTPMRELPFDGTVPQVQVNRLIVRSTATIDKETIKASIK